MDSSWLSQIKDFATKEAIRILGIQVDKLTRGAFTGTLSPDQRPKLALKDVDTQFFSTDFARGYQWTGTAWQDLPDAPGRFQAISFAQSPEPPIGWCPCDGRGVTRSTSTGDVTFYQAPNIPPYSGLSYWVRL